MTFFLQVHSHAFFHHYQLPTTLLHQPHRRRPRHAREFTITRIPLQPTIRAIPPLPPPQIALIQIPFSNNSVTPHLRLHIIVLAARVNTLLQAVRSEEEDVGARAAKGRVVGACVAIAVGGDVGVAVGERGEVAGGAGYVYRENFREGEDGVVC